MRARDRIQKQIDKLLSFDSIEQWGEYLNKKALNRKVFYHYTTLEALKNIVATQEWRIGRLDFSNDPCELPFYCLSLSRGLNCMGMWGNYSRPSGNGVRIKIPAAVIQKYFLKAEAKIYDVAYFHPGTENSCSLEYESVTLHGKSIPSTLYCTLNVKKNCKDKIWPCFIKSEMWSYENETRVVYPCVDKKEKYLFIKLDKSIFRQLTFELAPDFLLPNNEYPNFYERAAILRKIFNTDGDLLKSAGIKMDQFKILHKKSKAALSKKEADLFFPALLSFLTDKCVR